jgi:hypothetical protein
LVDKELLSWGGVAASGSQVLVLQEVTTIGPGYHAGIHLEGWLMQGSWWRDILLASPDGVRWGQIDHLRRRAAMDFPIIDLRDEDACYA